MAGILQLIIFDVIMSFMWVLSIGLIKLFDHNVLGFNHHGFPTQVFTSSLSILNMFFFACLVKLTDGGAYNPVMVLSTAFSGNFDTVHFIVRVPVQVLGAITGVRFILATFPEIGRGPQLAVSPYEGALIEGLLTFTIVRILHELSYIMPGSFFRKNGIASVSKLVLRKVGFNLTGGCMNPAFVMGWAVARGDDITKEWKDHLLVYWIAPFVATLLASWTFRYLVRPSKQENDKKTN